MSACCSSAFRSSPRKPICSRFSGDGFNTRANFYSGSAVFCNRRGVELKFPFILKTTFPRNDPVDSIQKAPGYKIWGVDGVIYGPVELPTLVCWIKEERVNANTWIYQEEDDAWHKAGKIQELQMFF